MSVFQALVIRKEDNLVQYEIEQIDLGQLSNGEVLIKVDYSSINYKDMLAIQQDGGVIRDHPMIPGIDLSGTIVATEGSTFKLGEEVIVTGFSLGMSHTGGFAEYARVPEEWIIARPNNLSLKDAMVFGTAGLTAALSIQALEGQGMNPESNPSILVTGSTGGVGSLALQILRKAGYRNITGMVRKEQQVEVAKNLGAHAVMFAKDVAQHPRPLEKQQFNYILDTVGGAVAAALLPKIFYGGSMSMCGNAAGNSFSGTVLPFILRGISILGIDSVNVTLEEREQIWTKLANQWNITSDALTQEISLQEVPSTIDALKSGQHLGRTIIKY